MVLSNEETKTNKTTFRSFPQSIENRHAESFPEQIKDQIQKKELGLNLRESCLKLTLSKFLIKCYPLIIPFYQVDKCHQLGDNYCLIVPQRSPGVYAPGAYHWDFVSEILGGLIYKERACF